MKKSIFAAVLACLAPCLVHAARETYNFNQNWGFHRPSAPAAFVPDAASFVAQGEFERGRAQDVTFAVRTARFVCLQATSSHGGGHASIAEFNLLDAQGKVLPRDGWKVIYVDSDEPGSDDFAACAIDGNPETKWHTAWKTRSTPLPHCIVIDLGAPRTFAGFRYLPRHDGNSSGMIKGWRFHASTSPSATPAALESPDSLPSNVEWETVNLPHSVRLEPINASGGRNYQGVCWYRKVFAGGDWKGRKVYMAFEGAMQVADIWLNGHKFPTHFGGYQPFTIDVTDQLLSGGRTNQLVVRLDNSDNPEVPPAKPQGQLDFTYFGGLYRDVRLVVMNPLHITDEILANKPAGGGIFVRYPQVSAAQAVVDVQTDVANEHPAAKRCTVRQELLDASDAVVGTATQDGDIAPGGCRAFNQSFTLANPQLWHPNHPHLYTLRTEIRADNAVIDQRVTRIGIRRIEFKPEGLFINGEKFFASGCNRHQDHPYVGYALPDSAHYRDARKIREEGFTSFRSHYPQDPAFMDACDELGIVCIVSNPGWQFFGNQTFVDRTIQNAHEMVRRDRNHPSAVLWEPTPNETSISESYCRAVNQAVHDEYPGDQCFTGGDGGLGNGAKILNVCYGRERIPGKPVWAREWGDSVDNWGDQQGRVRIARGWGELPMLVQLQSHIVKLNDLYKNTGDAPGQTILSGAGLWAGIDCYRGYHRQPFLGGPLDLFRLPKFDYYFFQSQRPPDVKLTGVDSGPMVFIANFGSAWSPHTVTVLSNCEEVRFYAGGKLLDTRRPDAGFNLPHPPFTFETKKADTEKTTYYMTNTEPGYHYQPSAYKAEGLIGGKVVATHEIYAPGVMRAIKLEVDTAGRDLIADGGDWIRVYAKIVDGRGTVHPMADDPISFSVEGEGAIIGDATIGANPVKAEAGIATALVRSTTKPGRIVVRASSFGLSPGEVIIESKPLAEKTWN